MKLITQYLPAGRILALSAILAAVPAARAADETAPAAGHKAHRGKMAERMATQLGLNDDQRSKMKALSEQEKAEAKAIHDDTSLDSETRRAKMKDLHQKYVGERQALMTPEQREKADKMREQVKARAGKNKETDAQ